MSDAGHKETDKLLEKIEKEVSKEYERAEKELTDKLDDYFRRFQIKDELKRKAVQNGIITQNEYDQWRIGQLAIGKRWEEMRNTIVQDLTNANQIAKSIGFDHMPEVYAVNHNYATFEVEKGSLMDTSYTLYDRDTVERLFVEENTFYPSPGKKLTRLINEGKDVAWNKRQVQSVLIQGILQGESIPNMATRLANTVGEKNRKAAIRNVRTMTTGIENAGRMEGYKRAQKMGINLKRAWLATLDGRTRHWHRELDGQIREIDKPFENSVGKIIYPGDPSADPENIYNCRCTLVAVVEGVNVDYSDTSLRHNANLGNMTYDEWKKEKKSYSDKITKQDDIAKIMKSKYNNEYRSYLGKKPIYNKSTKAENDISISQFGSVDNSQNFEQLEDFVNQKLKMTLDSDVKTLDFQSVKEGVQGINYIYSEFPKAQKSFVGIGVDNKGIMSASYSGYIYYNPIYYKDRNNALNAHGILNGTNTSKFHPKGNNCFGSGAHEAGHILEKAIIDKKYGGISVLGTLRWNDKTMSDKIVSEACKNAKKLPECKGKRNYILKNDISTYAAENSSECIAEAVCDYALNKEKAAPLSKEIWKLLKKELG